MGNAACASCSCLHPEADGATKKSQKGRRKRDDTRRTKGTVLVCNPIPDGALGSDGSEAEMKPRMDTKGKKTAVRYANGDEAAKDNGYDADSGRNPLDENRGAVWRRITTARALFTTSGDRDSQSSPLKGKGKGNGRGKGKDKDKRRGSSAGVDPDTEAIFVTFQSTDDSGPHRGGMIGRVDDANVHRQDVVVCAGRSDSARAQAGSGAFVTPTKNIITPVARPAVPASVKRIRRQATPGVGLRLARADNAAAYAGDSAEMYAARTSDASLPGVA